MVKVSAPPSSADPFTRVDEHNGLAKGDLIRVRDEDGVFKVTSIVVGDDGAPLWVDAFGGVGYPGKEAYAGWRSFSLDRILLDSSGQAQTVESGRRDSGLLVELEHELARNGTASRPAPDDPKAEKSLRERFYTAARRMGVKVRVRNVDGMIVAKLKDESVS